MKTTEIRFGIIGRNFVTDMMLDAMAAVPEIEVSAVYSRDAEAAASFAAAHGFPYSFSDLNDLAACPHIDAVYIASPNSCHYEQAKIMLNAGKHVLCEKPACSNADQVRELVSLAAGKNLVFLEAMRPVFAPQMKIVRDLLPKIAPLRQIAFFYCKPSSRYRLFLEKGNSVNTFNPELSNAAVMDLGCYGIHSLVYLFGRPLSVCAASSHLENGFEAGGTVLMQYPGFTASVTYSKVSYLSLPSVLSGENGMIFLDQVNHTERMWIRMNGEPECDAGFRKPLPNDMTFELRSFYHFISEGVQPRQENENSIITAEILDEVRRQTGTVFPADKKH